MATTAPTKTQVVAHLTKLLVAEADTLQLGDKAAVERTIRILKRK